MQSPGVYQHAVLLVEQLGGLAVLETDDLLLAFVSCREARAATTGGGTDYGDNINAVFDAPPLAANILTADYGARMWASVRQDGPGFTRTRIVLGSGGFGHGQAAGGTVVAGASLPGALLPAVLAGVLMRVEAELRGVVA